MTRIHVKGRGVSGMSIVDCLVGMVIVTGGMSVAMAAMTTIEELIGNLIPGGAGVRGLGVRG